MCERFTQRYALHKISFTTRTPADFARMMNAIKAATGLPPIAADLLHGPRRQPRATSSHLCNATRARMGDLSATLIFMPLPRPEHYCCVFLSADAVSLNRSPPQIPSGGTPVDTQDFTAHNKIGWRRHYKVGW